ncbi:cupin domain-containing protein [Uniformispora flossi]|uniref:cupin domain-containing protein n=1 Tax=Uniformispora flossi TaxID=3390723 RepID=UPI003C2B2AB0
MTYAGARAALDTRHARTESGSAAALFGGASARPAVPGHVTQGRFGLHEWLLPPHGGLVAPHSHTLFSESFHVVFGTVQVYDGERWTPAPAGDFRHVPEGRDHGFRNDGDEPAAMLVLVMPGAPREAYFRELAEISAAGRDLSDAEWDELWERYVRVGAT